MEVAHSKGFPSDSFFKSPNSMFDDAWIPVIGTVGFTIYALILRRYDHRKNEGFYESHEAMANLLGLSKTTVEKHLHRLQEFGLIDRRPVGRRKHHQWQYWPVIPVPSPSQGTGTGVNRPAGGLMSDRLGQPKTGGIDQMTRKNRPFDEIGGSTESVVSKRDTSISDPPKRLFKRLLIHMSPEEQVTYVLGHVNEVPLKTHVQIAWKYWCALWEAHYRSPYYPAKSKNPGIISKDKKNLRDKIEAVGFQEVIARMRRCFEVCDEMFPCVVSGKRIRPIMFNDFVNNRFFDQWIPMNRETEETHAKSTDEKLRAAREKRRAVDHGEAEKIHEGDE